MRDTDSTVAVAIPALNAEPYLAEAIESVLDQTYPHWLLTIVDNGSNDGTAKIAESYDDPRITVAYNERTLPMVENWNLAMGLGTGPLMKLLCADDRLHPNCLAEQVAVLEQEPDVVLTALRRDVIGAQGNVLLSGRGLSGMLGRRTGPEMVDLIVRSGRNDVGWPGSVMFRRLDFDAVGGFSDRRPTVTDLDLWIRLLARGDFVGLPVTGASFRVSPSGWSATATQLGREHRDLISEAAADPRWSVPGVAAARGKRRSRAEDVKRKLLYRSESQYGWPLRFARRVLFGAGKANGGVKTTGTRAVNRSAAEG